MECLLAICMYAEVALGYGVDEDVRQYLVDNPAVVDVAEEALDRRFTGTAAFGVAHEWGRVTGFAEVRHESDVDTNLDAGDNRARAGLRVKF